MVVGKVTGEREKGGGGVRGKRRERWRGTGLGTECGEIQMQREKVETTDGGGRSRKTETGREYRRRRKRRRDGEDGRSREVVGRQMGKAGQTDTGMRLEGAGDGGGDAQGSAAVGQPYLPSYVPDSHSEEVVVSILSH